MRQIIIVTAAALAAFAMLSAPAEAISQRTMTGAAIGAAAGAVVAGPVGLVAGGVAGGMIGGPALHESRHHPYHRCWTNYGVRHCR